jgi:hypothetical protein
MSLLGTGHTPSAGASAEAEALIEEARARARRRRRRIALTVVCIAALAAGALVATNDLAGGRPTATARGGGADAAAEPSGPPAYFLDATYFGGGYTSPQIRASATGKPVAYIPVGLLPQGGDYDPPYGLAATGPGSFLVGMMTSNDCATRFFRFRLDAGGRPGALTPFGPTLPGDLTGMAVSAGGGLLAYLIAGDGCKSSSGAAVGSYLGVLDTSTGRTRQWTDAYPQPQQPQQLSMSANGGLLAFSQLLEKPVHGGFTITGAQVRVLPTNAPPGTVAERSRVAARISPADTSFVAPTVLLSPTGTSFYLCSQPFAFPRPGATRVTETAQIIAYRTATGTATGVIAAFSASYPISRISNGDAPLSLGCSSMALDPSGRFLLVPYLTTLLNPKDEDSAGSLTAARINTGTRARTAWTLRFGERQNPGQMSVAW